MVSARTGDVVDAVHVVAATSLDLPFLYPQLSEEGRRQGPVALAKTTACWAENAGLAIHVATYVKPGCPPLVPSCCSGVKAGAVGHLEMLALVRYLCGSNVRHHVLPEKKQLTARVRQMKTYNRPK